MKNWNGYAVEEGALPHRRRDGHRWDDRFPMQDFHCRRTMNAVLKFPTKRDVARRIDVAKPVAATHALIVPGG
jgi:hypothetical protein